MATWETQLLSRIVRLNQLTACLQWGITESDFLTNEGRSVFLVIMGYYMTPESRGSVIGENTLRNLFPSFQLYDDVSMTTEALCMETRKHRLRVEMKAHIQQSLELVDHDPLVAADRLALAAKDIINLGLSKNADVHFHDAFDRSVHRAMMVAQGYDFSVAKWMWKPLQRATMGIQVDDYVVFYGRPKSMKSWVLAACGAHLTDQDKRLVIYTKEMTADNIFQRMGCCLAGIDYDRFRHGDLTAQEWCIVQGTQKLLHQRSLEQTIVCLNAQDAPKGGDTVEWLDSKVEKYQPDLVLIDGMYLMSDSKGAKKKNEKVANISNELRQLNLSRKKPIIATLQANRDAAKNTDANLDEIAFSDAIGQDATLLMRIINEHKSGKPTLAVIVGGARECNLDGFRIWGKPAADFGDVVREGMLLTAKDVEQARTDDTGDNDNVPKKAGAKKDVTEGKAVAAVQKRMDRQLVV